MSDSDTGTHDDLILDLVKKLMDLEFERGQLYAQLSLHFRIRAQAEMADPPVNGSASASILSTPTTTPAPRRKRGVLERAVCAALPGTSQQIAQRTSSRSDSVLHVLRRLESRHLIVQDGEVFRLCTKE